MLSNLKFSLRQLFKSPGFTALAIIALALGIGANTAIFSIIHAVLLRPLAFPEPDRLVRVWASAPERGLEQAASSYPRFDLIRAQQQVFSELAANTFTGFNLTGRGDPENVPAMQVSARFFQTLGLQPLLGRTFLPEEDRPGGAPVVLISHGFWQRRFAGDPHILGQSLTLNGTPHTVIGVLPPTLPFPFNQTDLWAARPFELQGLTTEQVEHGAGYLFITARLKPGLSLARAQEAMRMLATRYREAWSQNLDAKSGIVVIPFQEEIVGNQKPALYLLFAAVGFVLLIACANVANLLLVRFSARRKEIAVRAALGATRRQIVGQFLTESVLMALVAGALGILLADWSLALFTKLAADFLPRVQEIGLDRAVLAFTLALSLLTGFLLGLAPAAQVSRPEVSEALKDSTRGSTGGARHVRFRNTLLVGEVALALVLLIGAGLLISSFVRLQRLEPGFTTRGVFTALLALPPAQYDTSERQAQFYEQLLQRLAVAPGVRSASLADAVPLSNNITYSPYAVVGRPVPITEQPIAIRSLVSPGYFAALGITLKQGRPFTERDRLNAPMVTIINQTLAKQLFPNGNPLGQRLVTGIARMEAEIVGVAGDTLVESLTTPPRAQMYFPTLQRPLFFTSLLVRTDGDPSALAGTVRAVLHQLDANLPLINPQTFDGIVSQSIADRRLTMALLSTFAGLALVLAAIGIYSVMACTVSQRTGEIGIRMALGADPGDVQRLVIGQGLKLAGTGIGLGVVAAFALTRLMSALLFNVSTGSPFVYVAVAAVIALVAVLACWLPARRAARIDPLSALRAE